MVLFRVISSAASTSSLTSRGGEGVLDPEPGFGGGGAEPDQQVALAGAGVSNQAERLAGADPGAGGQGVDGGRVDVGVGVEVEVVEPFVSGKAGGLDPAGGAAPGPVVALGEQQLGEEAPVGRVVPSPPRSASPRRGCGSWAAAAPGRPGRPLPRRPARSSRGAAASWGKAVVAVWVMTHVLCSYRRQRCSNCQRRPGWGGGPATRRRRYRRQRP